MAILAECPMCHRKQKTNNKQCSCGADLVKAKRSKKVKYWINYRLPDGKQKREYVGAFDDLNGYSIEDANKAHSKRVVQKAENRLLDIKPDTKMTFKQLSEWYLNQEDIKEAPSYRIIEHRLNKLNEEIGNYIVCNVKPMDLENYRSKLEKQGLSDSYIDDILTAGKTVVNKAFENGMIGIESLRNFKAVKKTLSAGDNRRDKILTVEEFQRLQDSAADHLKGILLAGYWTGLRENDVLSLTWDRIDLQNRIIKFEVKHRRRQKPKPREVYICDELHRFLLKHDNRLREAGEDNHVFHYNGNPIQNIKRAVKTACEKAKIPYGQKVKDGFVFHDLRHTSVTDMRRSGIDPLVNKVWHGHSTNGGAHEGYHTFNREDLRRAGHLLQEYRDRQRTDKEDDQFVNVDQTVDQTAKNGK